jgi:hypothetical protein
MIEAEANVFSTIFNPEYLNVGQYEKVTHWQNINDPMSIDVTPAIPNLASPASGQKKGNRVQLDHVVGMIYDEDALAGEPDLVLGENDFREIIHPEICTVRFCEKPILGSDGKLHVYLTNPAGQKSSLKIDVYAVIEKPNSEGKIEYAPDELLGSSYFVRPGEYLPTVEIKGNHEKNEKIYLKISSRDNETGESHGFFYVPALLLK